MCSLNNLNVQNRKMSREHPVKSVGQRAELSCHGWHKMALLKVSALKAKGCDGCPSKLGVGIHDYFWNEGNFNSGNQLFSDKDKDKQKIAEVCSCKDVMFTEFIACLGLQRLAASCSYICGRKSIGCRGEAGCGTLKDQGNGCRATRNRKVK